MSQAALLIDATKRNDVQALTALLEQGCDPNSEDNEGRTALCYASANPKPEILKLLIKYGADVNKQMKNYPFWSPLHFSCHYHIESGIRALMQSPNIVIGIRDGYGRTPLECMK